MLRNDVKYMLDSDWEPSIPSQEIITKQSNLVKKHGIYTNIRFYLGLIKSKDEAKKLELK